jgi:hypothetical protein
MHKPAKKKTQKRQQKKVKTVVSSSCENKTSSFDALRKSKGLQYTILN